jgi:hypothetical protein
VVSFTPSRFTPGERAPFPIGPYSLMFWLVLPSLELCAKLLLQTVGNYKWLSVLVALDDIEFRPNFVNTGELETRLKYADVHYIYTGHYGDIMGLFYFLK